MFVKIKSLKHTYLLHVKSHVFRAELLQAIMSTPCTTKGMHLHEFRHVRDQDLDLKKCCHWCQIGFNMGNWFPCFNYYLSHTSNSSLYDSLVATLLTFLVARFWFPWKPTSLNGFLIHHHSWLWCHRLYMISGGGLINGHETFLLLLMGSHWWCFLGSIGIGLFLFNTLKVQNI